jgi:hypothetical protein
MNWEAIGAIGEIVGAAAVVVTLAFLLVQLRQLAEQTRQNTLAIKLASYGTHAETLANWQHGTAKDQGLSEIMYKCQRATAYNDPAIQPVDWWRYSLTMRAVFSIHEDLFFQHEAGLDDDPYWDHRCQYLAQNVRNNRVAAAWWAEEVAASAYVDGFINAINDVEVTIAGEYLNQ